MNEQTTAPETDAPNFEKLIELASAISSAQDAMTDDIVTRLASTIGEGMILMDRITRNQGLMSLLQVLNEPLMQKNLECMAEVLKSADFQEVANSNKQFKSGGYSGLMRMLKDPNVQEAVYMLSGIVAKISSQNKKNNST